MPPLLILGGKRWQNQTWLLSLECNFWTIELQGPWYRAFIGINMVDITYLLFTSERQPLLETVLHQIKRNSMLIITGFCFNITDLRHAALHVNSSYTCRYQSFELAFNIKHENL